MWVNLLSLLVLLGVTPLAQANGVDRGGGDAYEQEFRVLGHQVATKLLALRAEAATHKMEIAPELLTIDVAAFLVNVDSIPVVSTDEPVLVLVEGKLVPREAANSFTDKMIWVNRPMWDNPANGHIPKQSIALHEYLGTMNVDRAYQISLLYRQRLEFEADTTQFKVALTDQLKELGGALADQFKVNFEPAFARMETIATTGEYQRCTDKKWDASKPERQAECFGVTAMILRAARLQPVPAETDLRARAFADGIDGFVFEMLKAEYHCGWAPPRALFNRLFDSHKKWQIVCPKIDGILAALQAPRRVEDTSAYRLVDQKYLAFMNELPSLERKNFAMQLHNKLVEEFNMSMREVNAQLQEALSSANKACPGGLAEGIRCAIPRVLDTVTLNVEPAMRQRQRHLRGTMADGVRATAEYAE